jgi:hypothetical protein
MTEPIMEQMEPIPGYRLIERLGRGGFGEVWKSTAPGGLFKAVKFVHGALDEAGSAAQEFKSLQRIKSLNHPFILSLERIDVVEDQLVIVMELADRNLMDRFNECKQQGYPGIPRDELLRYMREAAEALDLLNREHQIQHLDIKPQNLFLIRNHIKVADFGLAKDLEGTQATLSSGITPTYAAPETFESVVSQHCDQYSLGIVYQELLTGQRPFDGKNARQLLLQHLSMPPDLDLLPEEDRPIVGRALAKKPLERFPSCLDFVRALPRQAALPAPVAPPAAFGADDATAPNRRFFSAPVSEPEPVEDTKTPAPQADRSGQKKKKKKRKAKPGRADEALAEACPRCGAAVPPGKPLDVCSACGFAPHLEEAPKKPGWRLPMPAWYWILSIGAVLIVVGAVAGHLVLPAESETRSIWGLSQLGVGLVLLFVAQLWAVFVLAGEEAGIGLREVFLPTIKVWWQTAKRLPVTRWPVYLATWGLLAAVCGLAVGDMMYWNRRHDDPKDAARDARKALAAMEEEARREERRTVALLEERARQLPPAAVAGKEGSEACVTIGYIPSDDGSTIRGLVVARVTKDGKLESTEVVESGFSDKDRDELLRRFQKIERTQPPSWWKGSAPSGVVWVGTDPKSAVVCEVETKATDKNGKPTAPRYKGIVRDEP